MASQPTDIMDERADAFLSKGRGLVQREQYNEATSFFLKVSAMCGCGVLPMKKPCACKDLRKAIAGNAVEDGRWKEPIRSVKDLASDTLELELKKKCICSARSGRRCKWPYHIAALGHMADAEYARGDEDLAFAYAYQLVNLNPRDPKGYLHLGMLFTRKRDRIMAYLTYEHGSQLVSSRGSGSDGYSELVRLREMGRRWAIRFDPLPALPAELAIMVFRQINSTSLVRCLRVCKGWKKFLTLHDGPYGGIAQTLWRSLNFTNTRVARNRIKPVTIANYYNYAGQQFRDVTIDRNDWDDSLTRLLLKARGLESLSFQGRTRTSIHFPPQMPTLPRLKALKLSRLVQCEDQALARLLRASAETLEELCLLQLQTDIFLSCPVRIPPLRNLRSLRIAGYPGLDLPLLKLRALAPSLKELWLGGGIFCSSTPDESLDDEDIALWDELESFLVEDYVEFETTSRIYPLLSSNLREIRLRGKAVLSICRQGRMIDQQLSYPCLDKAKKLSIDYSINPPLPPGLFEALVRPGLESGSLEELDWRMFPFHEIDLNDSRFSWFASDKLKYLGTNGIGAHVGDDWATGDFWMKLAQRFPNLESIDISSEGIRNSALASLIQRGIRTIYQEGRTSRAALLDTLLDDGDKVKIVEGRYPVFCSHREDREMIDSFETVPRAGIRRESVRQTENA
ncbi:hypothetical protein F5Y15DRAFT_363185 [Xylariaceae sp. FL0016]|nr:hypothetical protein F5Y15DRAFT_363185 [Xylariaceae sp. FL0016]